MLKLDYRDFSSRHAAGDGMLVITDETDVKDIYTAISENKALHYYDGSYCKAIIGFESVEGGIALYYFGPKGEMSPEICCSVF